MKVRLSILAALCAAFCTSVPPALGDSPGGSDGSATHYLSLGDSLADRGGNPEDCADNSPDLKPTQILVGTIGTVTRPFSLKEVGK
jgi:hypothetical protein